MWGTAYFLLRSVQANCFIKRVRSTFSSLTVYFIIRILKKQLIRNSAPTGANYISPIKSGCSKTFLHCHNHAAVSTFSPQQGWCEPRPRVCGSERERCWRERGQRRAKDWCHSLNHLTKSPTSYGYNRGQQGGRRTAGGSRERVKGKDRRQWQGKRRKSKWEESTVYRKCSERQNTKCWKLKKG